MEKSFRRRFDSLGDIFHFTEDFFSREGIDASHRFAIDFAVEEIFTNCVKFHPDAVQEITIGLTREDDRVKVVVTDVGVEAFDITRVAEVDTDLPLEERSVGGLGIHLTRKLMDEIAYRHDDRTSRIIMTRLLR